MGDETSLSSIIKYGLKAEQLEEIIEVFKKDPGIQQAVLFGSRAKGNYKPGSDIDIALKGRDLNFDYVLRLNHKLDELNLPYKFDILIYDQIKDADVIAHINRVGIVIYSRTLS